MPNDSAKVIKQGTSLEKSGDVINPETCSLTDDSKIKVSWMDVAYYFNAPGAFLTAAIALYLDVNFFLSVWVSFVLMPFVDSLLELDDKNVSKEAQKKFEKDWKFKVPVYLVIISDFIFYFYVLYGITTGKIGNTPL
jgi:hypothetical protein